MGWQVYSPKELIPWLLASASFSSSKGYLISLQMARILMRDFLAWSRQPYSKCHWHCLAPQHRLTTPTFPGSNLAEITHQHVLFRSVSIFLRSALLSSMLEMTPKSHEFRQFSVRLMPVKYQHNGPTVVPSSSIHIYSSSTKKYKDRMMTSRRLCWCLSFWKRKGVGLQLRSDYTGRNHATESHYPCSEEYI